MSLEDLADLVANCSCDEPHSPGGNAGNAAIVDPCERPDVEPPAEPEDNEPPVEPEENEPPVEPEDNEPPAEPEDHESAAPIAAEPSEPSEPEAPAPAPMDELPQTGNRGQIATTALGFLLAALGVVLLVTSRRRTADPLG